MKLREHGVSTTVVDGRTVILDTVSSEYLTANRAGSVLIESLQSGDPSRDELVARLTDRYGIDRDVARADCDLFLDQLRQRRLLAD